MIFDVRALASKKGLETGHAELEWLRALESARQSLRFVEIDYFALEQIALASRSPDRFVTMTRLIYQYGKSNPHGESFSDVILGRVDSSPFALGDWIDAIQDLHSWLQQEGRAIDFLSMLKYLECCVASPEATEAGQSLATLVGDMLKVHGYES